MKTVFLFPGQASQYVSMLADVYQSSEKGRQLIEMANQVLGFSISDIMFNGPEEDLKQTEITQPAIFIHSYVMFELIGGDFQASAGHSLGEYSALAASGVFDFETGLKLVRLRGQLMQKAGTDQQGTMAAIVGASTDVVEAACLEAGGLVIPANFNSPGQIVISGEVDAVRAAMELAKLKGAKIAKELVVSGAFHSPLMKTAEAELSTALNKTPFHQPTSPVYQNVSGQPETDPDRIRQNLIQQLTSPVLWEQSINNMKSDGFDHYVEIGPGKVLQGLVKRIVNDVNITGYDKLADIGDRS